MALKIWPMHDSTTCCYLHMNHNWNQETTIPKARISVNRNVCWNDATKGWLMRLAVVWRMWRFFFLIWLIWQKYITLTAVWLFVFKSLVGLACGQLSMPCSRHSLGVIQEGQILPGCGVDVQYYPMLKSVLLWLWLMLFGCESCGGSLHCYCPCSTYLCFNGVVQFPCLY